MKSTSLFTYIIGIINSSSYKYVKQYVNSPDGDCYFQVLVLSCLNVSRGIVHNMGACAVAGIGGLGNEAKQNAKTDLLRFVPRD